MMRLWHDDLISKLPRQQLLGQHRECCALRGNGWGKPHSTVDYIFNYPAEKLFQYHYLVMEEMENRGYNVSSDWKNPYYRGKKCEPYSELKEIEPTDPIYPEHDGKYLQECLDNLKGKGIEI